MRTPNEAKIHFYFMVSLIFKCAFAIFEIVAGIGAYVITAFGDGYTRLVTEGALNTFVYRVLAEELIEDPQDFIANHLIQLSQGVSLSELHFVAFYLLSHGVIKLWLIIGLFQKKLWYYPMAIIVFGLFIVYQLYRYSFTHSVFLLFITVVDAAVIWLTWREYKNLKRSV